jgi:hypothetical protein
VVGVDPVVAHLVGVPSEADAEDQPPIGNVVERRHRLRQNDRVVLTDEADAGSDGDRVG